MFDFENQSSLLNYDSTLFRTIPDNSSIIDDTSPVVFYLGLCVSFIIYNAETKQSMMLHYAPSFEPDATATLKINEFLKKSGQKEAVVITQYPSISYMKLVDILNKNRIPISELIYKNSWIKLIVKYDPMTLEIKVQREHLVDLKFKINKIIESKRERVNPVLSQDFLKAKEVFVKIQAGELNNLIKTFDNAWKLGDQYPSYLECFLNYAFKSIADDKINLLLCLKIIMKLPNLSEIIFSSIKQGNIISYEHNMKYLDEIISFIKNNPNSINIFKSIVLDICKFGKDLDPLKVKICMIIFTDLDVNQYFLTTPTSATADLCSNSDYSITHIESGSDLFEVLLLLPSKQRFELAKANEAKIENTEQLVSILNLLDAEVRFVFATANQDKIRTGDDLYEILEVLPRQHRIELLKANQAKIENKEQLVSIFNLLDAEVRFAFATEHQDKIKSSYDLEQVLPQIPENERFCFATVNQNKIGTGYELHVILNLIPDGVRLRFARANQDKIKSVYDLDIVTLKIPLEERIFLATELKDTIKNGYDLYSILQIIPYKSRLTFAIEQRDKIKTENDLGLVISLLPALGHGIFQKVFKGKSISQKEINEVLQASYSYTITKNGQQDPLSEFKITSHDLKRHHIYPLSSLNCAQRFIYLWHHFNRAYQQLFNDITSNLNESDKKSFALQLTETKTNLPDYIESSIRSNLCERAKNLRIELCQLARTGIEVKSEQICSPVPESYRQIASTSDDLLIKAKLLLMDYTKNNSLFGRVLYGHINRHHTEIIAAIIKDIDNNQYPNLENLLAKLREIPKNPKGSLARRVDFLEAALAESHYEDFKQLVNNVADEELVRNTLTLAGNPRIFG